jgi:hypothetical protein
MSLSKKIRFEVFKRDGFRCAYCGKTPPDALLEVDHIIPKAEGGPDDINNLITACFDCNRGKSKTLLSATPAKMEENLTILREKEEQYAEYTKLAQEVHSRILREADAIEAIYSSWFGGSIPDATFKPVTIKTFLQKLPYQEVEDSMLLAIARTRDPVRSLKYFCKICWLKIKGEYRA